MPTRCYGWKPAPPDHPLLLSAPKYSPPLRLAANLPSSVDLRSKFPAPYDQGQEGSCTANMSAGMIQYDQAIQSLPLVMPARQFDYYNSRLLEGTTDQDAGASIADAVQAIAKYGWCPESMWPYTPDRLTAQPPKACYDAASPNKVTDYASVPQDLGSLKSALASSEPVGIGFVVYPSFESDQVAQTGIVPMPNIMDRLRGSVGGHAILLVGYDDSRSAFLFRNSWGQWGIQSSGYGWMPYSYLTDSSLSSDFWILRSIPGSKPQPTPTPPGPGPSPSFAQTMRIYKQDGTEEAWYGLTRLD